MQGTPPGVVAGTDGRLRANQHLDQINILSCFYWIFILGTHFRHLWGGCQRGLHVTANAGGHMERGQPLIIMKIDARALINQELHHRKPCIANCNTDGCGALVLSSDEPVSITQFRINQELRYWNGALRRYANETESQYSIETSKSIQQIAFNKPAARMAYAATSLSSLADGRAESRALSKFSAVCFVAVGKAVSKESVANLSSRTARKDSAACLLALGAVIDIQAMKLA